MFDRRDSLAQVLDEIEAGGLTGAAVVTFSRRWWQSLSPAEQTDFRKRAERLGIELHVDDRLSLHYVEVRGGPPGDHLSSEHPL